MVNFRTVYEPSGGTSRGAGLRRVPPGREPARHARPHRARPVGRRHPLGHVQPGRAPGAGSRIDILRRFDYLSTVSGGGYIGACLASLLSHRSELARRRAADAATTPTRSRPERLRTSAPRRPLCPSTPTWPSRPRCTSSTAATRSATCAPTATSSSCGIACFSREVLRAVGNLLGRPLLSPLPLRPLPRGGGGHLLGHRDSHGGPRALERSVA